MEAHAGRIVLVEDMPFAGSSLKRLLELYGYEVRDTGGFDGALVECRAGIAPAALLVNLASHGDEYRAFRERAEGEKALEGIGVIGFASQSDLEDGTWKGQGIEAAVDLNAIPEELVFRINEALFKGRDLRRFARVFTNLSANCTVDDRSFEGRVTNLGQGGAFVQTDEPVAAGRRVRLRFRMPGAVVVSGEGDVRFVIQREPLGGAVHVSGLGVEFGKLEGNSSDSIAKFVAAVQGELRALLG